MRTVRDIIEDLGGQTIVASLHKPPIAQSTVYGWVQANFVPEWRRPEVMRIARKLRKPLTENDFPPKDKTLKLVG